MLFGVRSFASSAGGLTNKTPVQKTLKQIDNAAADNAKDDDKIADMTIFRTLVKYLWAKDNLEYRLRFVSALVLLAGAKV